jgi:hypothetical protein
MLGTKENIVLSKITQDASLSFLLLSHLPNLSVRRAKNFRYKLNFVRSCLINFCPYGSFTIISVMTGRLLKNYLAFLFAVS